MIEAVLVILVISVLGLMVYGYCRGNPDPKDDTL